MPGCLPSSSWPLPSLNRDLFQDHPIEDSIENQWTFLAQRLGGPPLYTERKGEWWEYACLHCAAPT